MLEFIKPGTYIDFMKYKWYFIGFSLITSLIAIGSIAIQGFSYGIDFAGGSVIQVQFKNPTTADDIRKAMKTIGMEDERIQSVGAATDNDFLIRTSMTEDTIKGLGGTLTDGLEKSFGKGKFEIRRVEMVGGAVSKDIKTKGFLSLIWAAVGILIYVWWRFEFKFSVGAIVATLHDVIIVLGMFSLLRREMDLTVVAAMLTLIGYSLNDTVVVFDRIRENIKKQQSPNYDIAHIMSLSISQTLSRTILTALTVFLVVIALFFLGGEVMHGFAMVMLIGVIIGCYSSIFIASPIVLFMSKGNKSS
jgi:preprotein translocase subunit SecF